MVHLSIIEARLSQLGIRSGRLSRPELLELQHILVEGEKIVSLANGRYFAGFATLVATNLRLLIIDKRPFFMTYEDIRYDMISELDYTSRLLDATLHIYTINKQHRFTSFKHRDHLRRLMTYVQQRVMQLRQYQPSALADQPDEVPDPAPIPPNSEPPVAPQPTPDPQPSPPPQPDPRTYRTMASKLSGRVLGPVAVKAAHHHLPHIPNPYTQASLAIRHSSGWFSYSPSDVSQVAPQPES